MAKELSVELIVNKVKSLNNLIINNEELEVLKFDDLHLDILKLLFQGINLETIKSDIFSNIVLHTRLKNNLNVLFQSIEFGVDTERFGITQLKKILKIIKRAAKKSLNLKEKIISEVNTSPFTGEVLLKILKDLEKRYDKEKKVESEKSDSNESEKSEPAESEKSEPAEPEKSEPAEINEVKIILEKLKSKKGLNQKDRNLLIKILETLS
jgi:hypothetical protein